MENIVREQYQDDHKMMLALQSCAVPVIFDKEIALHIFGFLGLNEKSEQIFNKVIFLPFIHVRPDGDYRYYKYSSYTREYFDKCLQKDRPNYTKLNNQLTNYFDEKIKNGKSNGRVRDLELCKAYHTIPADIEKGIDLLDNFVIKAEDINKKVDTLSAIRICKYYLDYLPDIWVYLDYFKEYYKYLYKNHPANHTPSGWDYHNWQDYKNKVYKGKEKEVDNRKIATTLSMRLRNDTNPDLRVLVIEKLKNSGIHLDLELLMDLTRDAEPNIRKAAAKELGEIGEPWAIELLSSLLLNDAVKSVQEEAINALARIGKLAVDHINFLLQKEKDANFQEKAAKILRDIEYHHGIETMQDNNQTVNISGNGSTLNEWRITLSLPDKEPDLYRLRILEFYDSKIEVLDNRLKDNNLVLRKDSYLKEGKIKDPLYVESLIKALKSDNLTVRENAVRALGKRRDPRAVEPLIEALKDDFGNIGRIAAEALGRIGEPVLKPLGSALEDRNHLVRLNAIIALGKIDALWDDYVNPLNNYDIYFEEWPEANNSVITLTQHIDIVDKLMGLLNDDEDWEVRERIARIMGEKKVNDAVEPLIGALKDEDLHVRKNAAWALGEIRNSRAIEPLILLLKKTEISDVIKSVVKALGKIGDSRVVEPLIAVLNDTDSSIQREAEEVLIEMRTITRLLYLLRDEQTVMRMKAVNMLGRIMVEEPTGLIGNLKLI